MRRYDCACTSNCTPPPACAGCSGCAPVIINPPQPGTAVAVRAFNTQAQTTVGGTPLTYGSSALISQNNAVVGTDSITLNDAGVYLISFNADVSAGEGLTPPADLTLQLNANGSASIGASATQSVADAASVNSVAFTTLITVTQSTPQALTVVPDTSDFSVTNASLTAVKVGN